MWFWIINISFSFFLCVFCAGFLIPKILLIAYRKDLFDEPDERKIHHLAVPRLGGLAFKPVIFLTMALLLGMNITLGHTEMLLEFGKESRQLAFLFCAIMVLYLIGMADDLIGIRYKAKFFVQILCGCCLLAAGVWFSDLHGILGLNALSPWMGYPLTLLVVVFIINSINLIDGIDGLASGLCSCALLVYGVAFFLLGEYVYAMLSFSTLGVQIPFFYYNVYGSPEKRKKIFMGDTGSLTVGMMLCFLSIKLSLCFDESLVEVNPMAVAFSPLIIPCFDVLRVYLHRVRNHQSPFLPDKNHIHHKLLTLGMRHRKVMMTIIVLSILIIACNIMLSMVLDITLLLAMDLAVWTLANVWLTKRIMQ